MTKKQTIRFSIWFNVSMSVFFMACSAGNEDSQVDESEVDDSSSDYDDDGDSGDDGDSDDEGDRDDDGESDVDEDSDGDGGDDDDEESDDDGDSDDDADSESDMESGDDRGSDAEEDIEDNDENDENDADGDSEDDPESDAEEDTEDNDENDENDADGDSEDDPESDEEGDNDTGEDSDKDEDSETDEDSSTDEDSDSDAESDDDITTEEAEFDVKITLSPVIQSVAIVEWSVDKSIDSAVIDFGRDEDDFEYQAPVTMKDDGNYRTVLLGMKPSKTYSVQISAHSGDTAYVSDVHTVETGLITNGLPVISITDEPDPDSLWGGFTVLCTGVGGTGGMTTESESWVLILDKDGDIVWWYEVTDTIVASPSRARMSYDGEHMWVGNFSNVADDGALYRVTMDGIESDSYEVPARHHDFGILPNGNVLFHEQANGGGFSVEEGEGPDIIKELDPETGDISIIYEQYDDFATIIDESNGSHTNYITYIPFMDAILFSMAHSYTVGLISYPEAELIGIFGGDMSWFSDMNWDDQYAHGVHLMEDTILLFNNRANNGGSSIFEHSYDLQARTSNVIFEYSSGNSSAFFGDVRRLPNGNTFITYCSTGVIHEIDASGNLLREMMSPTIGYTEHRKTLYGAPPPYDN